MGNALWLTWHSSQRSQNLSEDLRIPVAKVIIENNLFCRHLFSSLWAICTLIQKRPGKVYLQYSFLLLVVVAGYKRLAPFPVHVICDCHTKALRRAVRGAIGSIFGWIKKKSFSYTDVCIISNVEMESDLKKFTNTYCIVPDKFPNIIVKSTGLVNDIYCVFVGSYAVDEPLRDVIDAAERLDGEVVVYCTGRIPKEQEQLKKQPYKNVVFTDYLSRPEYEALISDAACILALTSEDGCLQCACYEAMSVDVPLVVSDTMALRGYCQNAAVYVQHNGQAIANGIRQAISDTTILQSNIFTIKNRRGQEYQKALRMLVTMVDSIS